LRDAGRDNEASVSVPIVMTLALRDITRSGPGRTFDAIALLRDARRRALAAGAPYAGLVHPHEAHDLMTFADAVLVDVRSKAEWELVGRVPGSVLAPWRGYPCTDPDPHYADALAEQVERSDVLLFLCRSGQRSHEAAIAAACAGFTQALNVMEGFEGALDAQGRRSKVSGWRSAGLPWIQN
jgi:rhodanese-related sulfurtransferase